MEEVLAERNHPVIQIKVDVVDPLLRQVLPQLVVAVVLVVVAVVAEVAVVVLKPLAKGMKSPPLNLQNEA